jgi:hypothetical protein
MQLLRFFLLYLFLNQFLSDLDENYIIILRKFRTTCLMSWFGHKPVLIGPKTAVFSGLSVTNWKDQDQWSV